MNYENVSPSVSSAFNNSCDPGDTVTDGSCTDSSEFYWSSTTGVAFLPASAWVVDFGSGFVSVFNKVTDFPLHVRAVRGGSR